MKRPNLLLIMTDQWRWDGLGVTGGWARTPNLDSLAQDGMLFNNCLTTSPVCIPARASFATGLYPHNTGVWGNVTYDMPTDTDTWMRRIQQSGYHTCMIGKTHWHRHEGDLRDRERYMNAYGFEDVDEIPGPRRCMFVRCNMTELWEKHGLWNDYTKDYEERFANKPYVVRPSVLPLELYTDVYVGQQAKKYLQDYQDDKPWFCMVSFGGPHEPWDTPEPYATLYDPEQMPKPIPRKTTGLDRPAGFLDHLYESGNPHSPDITAEEIAALRANYAGNITLIDEQIGEMIQAIKDRGEWDNTAVVFVSDHGEMNGDHGLIYKECFYNSAVKVPLIVSTPELRRGPQAGSRYDGMVEWIDVGATLGELAGAELNPKQYGKSLVDVTQHPDRVHREEAISEIHSEILIQNETHKMAINKDGVPYMLFDLVQDPDEQNNLIGLPEAGPLMEEMKEKLFHRVVTTLTKLNVEEIT